jgi:hypothetical protein
VALAGCSGEDDGADSASGSNDDATDSGGDSNSGSKDDGGQEADSPDVTILEHELVESELGDAHVEGKVKNTSGEEQSYIGIEAKFFNDAGERVGEGLDNADDVGDGRVVNFEIISTVDYGEVAEYELEASTSSF